MPLQSGHANMRSSRLVKAIRAGPAAYSNWLAATIPLQSRNVFRRSPRGHAERPPGRAEWRLRFRPILKGSLPQVITVEHV
jgi:hypothetical protein